MTVEFHSKGGIRRCLKCLGLAKSKEPRASGVWLYYRELYHMGSLSKHLRKTSNCLNVYEARTECGLVFEEEVDSSD